MEIDSVRVTILVVVDGQFQEINYEGARNGGKIFTKIVGLRCHRFFGKTNFVEQTWCFNEH